MVRITAGDKQGSGFIIDPNGVIITANHLVSVVSTASVELADGRKLNGNVVGRHIAADLAVLQISAQDLPSIPLGDSDELMPGDLIFKIGYTTESSISDAIVTSGIVTAFTDHPRSLNQVVQTDEPLKAGDSGGPLLNRRGEVIGVSSANIVKFQEEGAGYASTINQLSSNLDQLLAGNPVCPPTPIEFDGPTFRHNSLGYDVILPKGSNFGSDQQGDFVFLGRDTPHVGVTIHNPTSKRFFDDIEDFFDSRVVEVEGRNNIESVEILDFRPVCLDPIGDAIEVDVKVRAGSQDFLHRWLLFFTGSDAYFLEGSAPVSSWPVAEKWIDSLMYSFTFK